MSYSKYWIRGDIGRTDHGMTGRLVFIDRAHIMGVRDYIVDKKTGKSVEDTVGLINNYDGPGMFQDDYSFVFEMDLEPLPSGSIEVWENL